MMIGRNRSIRLAALGCALALFCAAPAKTEAASHHLIVCGSGGEDEYQQQFLEWGERLRDTLINNCDHAPDRVVLLTEPLDDEADPSRTTNLENITAALQDFSHSVGADEDVFVYLIGHGSFLRRTSKLLIPGVDLTAKGLAELLEPINARRIVVINASSASAGFINEISAPGRIVTSATKNTRERNATRFMEFFLQGLEEGSADQNRDERISVLEACRQAASMTDAWFIGEGLICTEHPLLDDNGDGFGSRLIVAALSSDEEDTEEEFEGEIDGDLAALCFIKDFSFSENVPRELVDRYLGTLDEIEQLKLGKTALDPIDYYAQLEELLMSAALANREIRTLSRPPAETISDETISDA